MGAWGACKSSGSTFTSARVAEAPPMVDPPSGARPPTAPCAAAWRLRPRPFALPSALPWHLPPSRAPRAWHVPPTPWLCFLPGGALPPPCVGQLGPWLWPLALLTRPAPWHAACAGLLAPAGQPLTLLLTRRSAGPCSRPSAPAVQRLLLRHLFML